MLINIEYLKSFIPCDLPENDLKELLASLGLEVAEIIHSGSATVFDVEITPNRPDWLSHLGVAREIYAKLPQLSLKRSSDTDQTGIDMGEDKDGVSVHIADPADCGRYTGCVLRGIRPAPSPEKISALLETLDLRPINQVVDASNLVLMTMGHPIHMFDLDKIAGREIHVRRARQGESLRLLDERDVALTLEDLVIADREKPIALAGVMGGLDSGVTDSTSAVFVESACFDPVRVRLTARRLGIQTDASYRFERGADIQATRDALFMALSFLKEWGNGDLSAFAYRDLFPNKDRKAGTVKMHRDFPSEYTGITIPADTARGILERLGFVVLNADEAEWRVQVPSHRVDIQYKQDLVEEVIRIHGYDRLNSTIPRTVNTSLRPARNRQLRERLRAHLNATGYSETLHYSFQSETDHNRFAQSEQDGKPVCLRNPLGQDYALMRNSLIPGLLRSTALNANHGALRVTLFEMGHRFLYHENQVREEEMLAVAATGQYRVNSWRHPGGEEYDYYLFRSEMSRLFARFGMKYRLIGKAAPWLKENAAFAVMAEEREVGWMGCVAPAVSREYDVNSTVVAMEINMNAFSDPNASARFREWTRMPSVRRDFSFFLPRGVNFAMIERCIEKNRPGELASFELVDFYAEDERKDSSDRNPALTLSFQYRDDNRTLTGEEANALHQELADQLIRSLKLIRR